MKHFRGAFSLILLSVLAVGQAVPVASQKKGKSSTVVAKARDGANVSAADDAPPQRQSVTQASPAAKQDAAESVSDASKMALPQEGAQREGDVRTLKPDEPTGGVTYEPQAQAPEQKSLTDIAREAIEARNNVLIRGNVEAAVKKSKSARLYEGAMQERLADALARHDALASENSAYTGFRTILSQQQFQAGRGRATLYVREYTVLKLNSSGGPPTSEYVDEHRFTFALQEGEWRLVSDVLLNLPPAEGPARREMPVYDAPTEMGGQITRADKSREVPVQEAQASSTLNRTAIVNYAVKYWQNYNTSYRSFGNDCTNFASQAVYAGGWPMTIGFYQSSSAWWYDRVYSWPGQSFPWAGAHNFYEFTRDRPRGTIARYFSDLVPGDILQVDWNDTKNNPTPDGHIDHTMVVTSKDSRGQIYLTYHSNSRLNKPLSELLSQFPKAKWYGWRLYSYPN
jgi:hypothetical protein